jgi:hypothetical protein
LNSIHYFLHPHAFRCHTLSMKTLFLLLAFGFASAQDLPCAKLLGNLPSSSLTGISTIEATFTIKYVENGSDAQDILHYVKDFVNNRAYLEHNVGYGVFIYHYQDGVGTVEEDEKIAQAPAEEDLESVQEMMELLEFDFTSLFGSDGVQSCDGQQSYGDLVTGEQVTVSSDGDKTSFVFDDARQLLALRFYDDSVESIPVTMFTELVVKDGLLQHGIVRYYLVKGAEAMLQEERVLEVKSYNQPLDESLFNTN